MRGEFSPVPWFQIPGFPPPNFSHSTEEKPPISGMQDLFSHELCTWGIPSLWVSPPHSWLSLFMFISNPYWHKTAKLIKDKIKEARLKKNKIREGLCKSITLRWMSAKGHVEDGKVWHGKKTPTAYKAVWKWMASQGQISFIQDGRKLLNQINSGDLHAVRLANPLIL